MTGDRNRAVILGACGQKGGGLVGPNSARNGLALPAVSKGLAASKPPKKSSRSNPTACENRIDKKSPFVLINLTYLCLWFLRDLLPRLGILRMQS